jgi:hypothetical protein
MFLGFRVSGAVETRASGVSLDGARGGPGWAHEDSRKTDPDFRRRLALRFDAPLGRLQAGEGRVLQGGRMGGGLKGEGEKTDVRLLPVRVLESPLFTGL